MTHDTLRYRLNELGLTQRGLARLLDVNFRTVRRWANGRQDIPEALAGRLDQVTQDEVADVMRRSVG